MSDDLKTVGQYKVLDADDVSGGTVDGWSLVERFVERDCLVLDSKYTISEDKDRVRVADRTKFLFYRPGDHALAQLSKDLEKAQAAQWGAEHKERSARLELEKLQKTTSTDVQEVLRLRDETRQQREVLNKYERHVASVRKEVGEERWRQIVEKSDDEEIPF